MSERIWLDPAWRGKGLGAVVLDRLVKKASRHEFAAVVLDPYPDEDREHPPVGVALRTARVKLEAYWEQAGFKRLGDHYWGKGFRNQFSAAALA
ncbi:MAG: GNAT family N-acetyltransferase [Microbacteriaceae bacterium]|jgi:GNAT superfamily N-acetyltransferase|nr:GNAT family N-acetyltransferase [Microbacteriaceae bacterium]